MADNLTQIAETFQNLNLTFQEINTSDIINTAINTANSDTNGLLGLFVLGTLSFIVFLFIIKNQRTMGIQERSTLILITLSVIIDFLFFLFKFNILESLQIVVFTYTLFIVVGMFAFIKKEVESPDQ